MSDEECRACATAPQKHGHAELEPAYPLRRELATLAAAGLLAAAALFFVPRHGPAMPWLKPALFLAAYLLAGWNVLAGAASNMIRGKLFDELFLMAIATLGAFAIGQFAEAVGVMIFYKIGEMLQESAVGRSRDSVRALIAMRPDQARLRRGGNWALYPAEQARAGEEFLVMPGERVPLDGVVLEGEAFMDSSALTGESLPRRVAPGGQIMAGFVAADASIRAKALRPASESAAARIIGLVENASRLKAKTERFLSRFAAVYTPIVVGLAACAAFLPPLIFPGQTFRVWLYRALVMLVISCPCALVVSVPLAYFAAIGGAARRGILVKGAAVFDALTKAGAAVFDKTGTLTLGQFRVIGVFPEPGVDENELLALAAAAESRSRHPIARSLGQEAQERGLRLESEDQISQIRERPGAGIVVNLGGKRVAAGNDRLLHLENIEHAVCDESGTAINVAIDGRHLGRIMVGDQAKAGSKAALDRLKAMGIDRIAMLTGDTAASAAPVAALLGIEELHAGLFPEDKLRTLYGIMDRQRDSGRSTIFVGDGLNDAPVLAAADVGVAMGSGSDAAVEGADIVLMTDDPGRVPEALERARKTRGIVVQNIVFALGVKAGFLAMGALGVALMWEAVIADVGVTLIAVANSLRALR